jgi:hypothetical protein
MEDFLIYSVTNLANKLCFYSLIPDNETVNPHSLHPWKKIHLLFLIIVEKPLVIYKDLDKKDFS